MMKSAIPHRSIPAAIAIVLWLTSSSHQVHAQATPGYNHEIPAGIMTPDKVQTPIGRLDFFDGMPTSATVDKVYDNHDMMRGTLAFLNGIPAASVEALRRGLIEVGVDSSSKIALADQLLDSAPLLLTGNTDTVYAFSMLDLKRGRRGQWPEIVPLQVEAMSG